MAHPVIPRSPRRPPAAGRAWLASGFSLLLLGGAAAASGQDREDRQQPAASGAGARLGATRLEQADEEELQKRIAELREERAGLDSSAANTEAMQRVIDLEILFLDEQRVLLLDRAARDRLRGQVTSGIQEEAQEALEAERAGLDGLDVEGVLAPLRPIQDLEELRRRVESEFSAPLRQATADKEQAERRLDDARTERQDLPQAIADLRGRLGMRRTEIGQLEQQLGGGLSPGDANLVRRRIDVRRLGVAVLEARIAVLEEREQLLEPLLSLLDTRHDAATLRFERLRRLEEGAQKRLQERIAVESRSLAAQLSAKQAEFESATSPVRRFYLKTEVEALEVKVEIAGLRARLQEAKAQAGKTGHDLTEAARVLGQHRIANGSGERRQDDVLMEITDLEAAVDRSLFRREARDLNEGLRAARQDHQSALDAHENFEADFEEILRTAEGAYQAQNAALSPTQLELGWASERERWIELKTGYRSAIEERKRLAYELRQTLSRLVEDHATLDDRRRETLVLLQRDHLFLRGSTDISLASLRRGLADLGRLPEALSALAGRVSRYFARGAVLQPAATCVVLLLLIGVALRFVGRWFSERWRNVDPELVDERTDRVGLALADLLRASLRAGFLFLLFHLPGRMLPDLELDTSQLLTGLGLVVGGFWLGRRALRIFVGEPPEADGLLPMGRGAALRCYGVGAAILYLSVVAVPIQLGLHHLEYDNPGMIELLGMAYRILIGLLLLSVLVLRSTFLGWLPGQNRALGRLARLVFVALHPFVVLLVPGLLILDALQYRVLAGLITSVSVVLVVVALAGWLAYHGLLLALGQLIEVRLPVPEDEEEADPVLDKRTVIFSMARFVLGLSVLIGSTWVFLALRGNSLEDLRDFLSVPLPMQEVGDREPVTLWNLIVALFLLLLTFRLVHHVKVGLQTLLLPRTRFDPGLQYTITTMTGYLVVALGLYLALEQVFDLENLGYVVAALSIGIGFGLQEVISNFISGLILLFERPLRVGDLIDVGGTEGVVKRIQIRSTTVLTRDNVWILVPNKDFITQNVTNFVYTDAKVRLRVGVGVAYGSDTALVRRAMLEVAKDHGKVLRRPAAEVWFVGFGESSLDFELLAWVEDPLNRYRVESDLRFAIDAAFRRYQITIPFPQRDLHVVSTALADGTLGRLLRPPVQHDEDETEQEGAEAEAGPPKLP